MRKKYKLDPETKRDAMAKRVPFFDLQYEMNNGLKFRGYVHEPRYADGTPMGFASSEDEPRDCAVLYSQWSRIRECNLDPEDIRCPVKCELCKLVGHTNDYMRGFTQSKGKRIEAKPHYPVPSTIGFQHTQCGTYMFDTRTRVDGMPLFRGYSQPEWNDYGWADLNNWQHP